MFKKSVQQQLLSYHYNGPRKHSKNNKLNLFGKAIAVIDKIKEPESLADIRQLDLSHNGISEIQNMEQFVSVEFINLSHNRIVDAEQLLKLKKLSQLHTLYLKGNPFLRDKCSQKVLSFLSSLNIDIEILSGQSASMIDALSCKFLQNLYFSHYLKKIQNHIQLINSYQLDDSFLNPDYAIFPKIKKIVEQNIKELSIRRQLVQEIDQRCFVDEEVLGKYLKKRLEDIENERSMLIKKIYDRQQLLRNVRSTYHQRVVPKKTVPRAMNGTTVTGYFSPPKLKESRKQTTIRDDFPFNKIKIKYKNGHENSSPHRSLDSLDLNEENGDKIMMKALIKMNPLYHLLHSPLNSLKPNEKELLIQNLALHLKEKIRQIGRYEKKGQQFIRKCEQVQNLQQHCRQISVQFKCEQEKTGEKMKKLSNLYQEESQKVENLREQIDRILSDLTSLKEQNDRLRLENSELKQKIALFESQEDLEEQIKKHFSKNLKKRYLGLLSSKAHHLSQLKLMHEQNEKVEQRRIKEEYFQNLKIVATLQNRQRNLKTSLKKKHFGYLTQMAQRVMVNKGKQKSLSSKILNLHKQVFIKLITQRKNRSQQTKQKAGKAKQKFIKVIKKKIFDAFKRQILDKNEIIERQKCSQISTHLCSKKVFRAWIRYITQHNQKEEACLEQTLKGIKRYYLTKFINFSKRNLQFKASSYATADFLIKMRKIKGYLFFSKTTSTAIIQLSIKIRKIELIRQHQYLFWFINTIRDCKIKKKMVVQNELRNRKIKEAQKLKQTILDKQMRQNKMMIFADKIRQMKRNVIKKILNRQQSWFALQKQKKQTVIRILLTNLRNNWNTKCKLSLKTALLNRSATILSKFKMFFDCFTIYKKKQLHFKDKSDRGILLKCLYRWKFFNSWSKMQSYKHMYEQLAPEISNVSLLQREIALQKHLLLQQIEQKDRIVRNCEKKFQEYEYMLHSKNLKYQKLKDIYADVVNQHQMNTTVKFNPKEKASEAEVYLKYRSKETTPTKYSLKTKIQEEDSYIKGRLYSQPDYIRDVPIDYQVKAIQPKGKESFLSSFKRF